MALSPYSSLKSAVAAWVARADLTARIVDFKTLAEARMNADARLRVRDAETTTDPITPGDDGVVELPDDYHVLRAVLVNSSPTGDITMITPGGLRGLYGGAEGATAYPGRYTFSGNTLTLWPPSTSSVTLLYYPKLNLVADSDTNWLLEKYPSAYLYAMLAESALFMQDDERLTAWMSMYSAVVDGIVSSDTQSRYAGAGGTIRGPTP